MNILKFIVGLFQKQGFGLDPELQTLHYQDNYKIGGIGDLFRYQPKHTVHEVPTMAVRDQSGQRTCVLESIASQKEVDEGVRLSPQSLGCWMKTKGNITRAGTSLSLAQDALRPDAFGIAEEKFTPNNYDVSFEEFVNVKHLTNEVKENALLHKIKSYFTTQSLYKVLEELDNGRVGQTASAWYSNHSNMRRPFIYDVNGQGGLDYHAYDVVGYDMGLKRLKCKNSFGEMWGEAGYFYVRFEDFNKVFIWGVYFNSDMPKDVISWLSINAGQAVKEKGSPKIYLIEGDKKRHIPDMPILHMLGKLTSFIEDKENVLPEVKEGEPIKLSDIHPDKLKEVREQIRLLKDANFLRDEYREYFPEYFN